MPGTDSRSTIIRFGVFEADPATGELRKSGRKIKIQEQPFQVLLMLLDHPGEMVSRDDLQKKLWPSDTFVNFDTGLNRCIKKIREALDDSAETPRFVETLPKRGYRFIAPVALVDIQPHPTPANDNDSATASKESATATQLRPRRVSAKILAGLVTVAALALALNAARNHGLWPFGRPQINAVAVLPLENLSGDAEDEFFADGMTDELTTQIAKTGSLQVISRTSVMQYKHTHKPLSQIARELNVDAIVEGTVTRSGGQVRVTAQLIDARTDRHLWAEEYERPLRDVLTLQSEVARGIAGEIRSTLAPGSAPGRQVNPEAFEAYLRGSYARSRMSRESLDKSLEYFEQAIRLDPRYAEAYAGASHTYYVSGILGYQPAAIAYRKAEAAAKKALDLDPGSAEAYNTLADVKKGYNRDWAGAEVDYKHALGLNPSYAIAHNGYADLLVRTGRTDAAVAEAKQARKLDPFSAQTTAFLGFILYQARRYDQAVNNCQTAIEFDPKHAGAHWWLALAYEQQHRLSEAIAELQKAAAVSGNGAVFVAALGHAYAIAGEQEKARRIIDELKLRSEKEYVTPFDIALVYVGLNDRDEAFRWLGRAYEERTMRLEQITEPTFDGLKSDPRLIHLKALIGLPPS